MTLQRWRQVLREASFLGGRWQEPFTEESAPHDGGYAALCPPYWCRAFSHAPNRDLFAQPAANWHDGLISSDFPKSRQARIQKIFRFCSPANQRHNSACLTHRGALAIVTNVRWDAMDAKRAQASGREAYGEVVWFGRRGAGVKSGRGKASLVATEAKEPFSGESTK